MNIIINENISLISVQQEFHLVYPYLKIDFFLISKGVNPNRLLENSSKIFKEFQTKESSNSIVITPKMSVNELEKLFFTEYGLKILIYRNSGRIWLATSATESWTLEEQNKQGKALNLD